MAKIYIFLFFLILNSKFTSLLIADKCFAPLSKWRGVGGEVTNQIQTNFDSNVRIATFETSLASKQPRQKTNLFKPKLPLLAKRGEGWGVGIFAPSRMG
jgi:hypothetical protein